MTDEQIVQVAGSWARVGQAGGVRRQPEGQAIRPEAGIFGPRGRAIGLRAPVAGLGGLGDGLRVKVADVGEVSRVHLYSIFCNCRNKKLVPLRSSIKAIIFF